MDDSVIDYPSDTESSLSRSSSLIQFESLERQLQNDSFSSSSPLLPVLVDQDFERFIPLAQLQLQHQNLNPVTVSIKTKVLLPTPYSLLAATASSSLDGCSVVSPTDKHHPRLIANHGATSKSTLSTFFSPATFVKDRAPLHRDKPSTFERTRGKSSQEELSEDSGYCGDHSQSIGSAEGGGDISSKQSACSDELDCTSLQAERVAEDEEDAGGRLKIATDYESRERHLPTSTGAGDHEPQQVGMADCGGLTCIDDCADEEVESRAINTRENKRTQHRKRNIPFGIQKKNLGGCQRMIPTSRSLPNIFLNQTTCDEAADNCNSISSSAPATHKGDHLVDSDDFKVNSFPEGLNYLLSGVCGSYSDEDVVSGESEGEGSRDFEECPEYGYYFLHHDHQEEDFLHRDTDIFGGTIASKNLDLNQFVVPAAHVLQQQSRAGVLSASYSNLTSLDYSATPTRLLFSKMDLKRTGGGGSVPRPTIANPEITLLDEVSFNFDKNLSIINDRCGNFEPLIEDKDGEEEEMAEAAMVIGILNIKKPPKPPPRRYNRTGDSLENLKVPSTSKSCSNASSRESLTFDRDPTNLVTCYAASLERCNFPTMDQPILHHRSTASLQVGGLVSGSDVDLGDASVAIAKETRHEKEMVVSTPNLSMRVGRELQVFNGNMSADCKSRTVGSILNSRNSLKEVSFHPIVSEISWRHEEIETDSLSEDSLNGDPEDECQENRGSDSDVESDGGQYRDEEDYFGLKKNENFKDLDLASASTVQKCKSTPVLSGTCVTPSVDYGQRQIITIKKTIILTPVS